ncbi:hypothetical protein BTVI_65159 [Pitangus sulphuratus]|nr:hypothetical protein BTVI_65159 [Pitangus sulphuratus]
MAASMCPHGQTRVIRLSQLYFQLICNFLIPVQSVPGIHSETELYALQLSRSTTTVFEEFKFPLNVGDILLFTEQQVPINIATVHHWQYGMNRDSVIPIHKMIVECQARFAFAWMGVQYTCNRLPQGWKHSPTICHGLIQAALEKGEAPEHLQYIDDIIVWGNMAEEVFKKGKIIQILLKAGFPIKWSGQGTCPRDPVPGSEMAGQTSSDPNTSHQEDSGSVPTDQQEGNTSFARSLEDAHTRIQPDYKSSLLCNEERFPVGPQTTTSL